MTVEKSELRRAAIHDLGEKFDDILEQHEADKHRCEGAAVGFLHASRSVQALMVSVQKDIEEDIYDIATAEHVKKYIERAVIVLDNLAKNANNKKLMAEGKMEALTGVIAVTKKAYDVENAKVVQATTPLEESADAKAVAKNSKRKPNASLKVTRGKAAKKAPVKKAKAKKETTPDAKDTR